MSIAAHGATGDRSVRTPFSPPINISSSWSSTGEGACSDLLVSGALVDAPSHMLGCDRPLSNAGARCQSQITNRTPIGPIGHPLTWPTCQTRIGVEQLATCQARLWRAPSADRRKTSAGQPCYHDDCEAGIPNNMACSLLTFTSLSACPLHTSTPGSGSFTMEGMGTCPFACHL